MRIFAYTNLYLTVETQDANQNLEILAKLRERGYHAELLQE
ncbi:MAG: hypothetical protein O2971_09295 [Proteobacteria bacterium]|nr:hypothetical protein [Pseudomonadota bacterium]